MNNKLNLIMFFAIFLSIISSVSAGSFIVHNTSDETKTYFIVNGTTGNVGIGTTTPTSKLDVNGNIELAGQINNTNAVHYGYKRITFSTPSNPVNYTIFNLTLGQYQSAIVELLIAGTNNNAYSYSYAGMWHVTRTSSENPSMTAIVGPSENDVQGVMDISYSHSATGTTTSTAFIYTSRSGIVLDFNVQLRLIKGTWNGAYDYTFG